MCFQQQQQQHKKSKGCGYFKIEREFHDRTGLAEIERHLMASESSMMRPQHISWAREVSSDACSMSFQYVWSTGAAHHAARSPQERKYSSRNPWLQDFYSLALSPRIAIEQSMGKESERGWSPLTCETSIDINSVRGTLVVFSVISHAAHAAPCILSTTTPQATDGRMIWEHKKMEAKRTFWSDWLTRVADGITALPRWSPGWIRSTFLK
jgi:hypothetical protein